MLKLRTILLSKYLYYGIFIIALIYTSIILNIPKTSNYKTPPTIISGTITSLTIIDNYLKITLKSSDESFILSYTFKNKSSCLVVARFVDVNKIPYVLATRWESNNSLMLYYPSSKTPKIANGAGEWDVHVIGY